MGSKYVSWSAHTTEDGILENNRIGREEIHSLCFKYLFQYLFLLIEKENFSSNDYK